MTDERMRLARAQAPSQPQQVNPPATQDVMQAMLEMMRRQQEETFDMMRTVRQESLAEQRLHEEEADRQRETDAAARTRSEALDAERRIQDKQKENRK